MSISTSTPPPCSPGGTDMRVKAEPLSPRDPIHFSSNHQIAAPVNCGGGLHTLSRPHSAHSVHSNGSGQPLLSPGGGPGTPSSHHSPMSPMAPPQHQQQQNSCEQLQVAAAQHQLQLAMQHHHAAAAATTFDSSIPLQKRLRVSTDSNGGPGWGS